MVDSKNVPNQIQFHAFNGPIFSGLTDSLITYFFVLVKFILKRNVFDVVGATQIPAAHAQVR